MNVIAILLIVILLTFIGFTEEQSAKKNNYEKY